MVSAFLYLMTAHSEEVTLLILDMYIGRRMHVDIEHNDKINEECIE